MSVEDPSERRLPVFLSTCSSSNMLIVRQQVRSEILLVVENYPNFRILDSMYYRHSDASVVCRFEPRKCMDRQLPRL